MCTYTQPFIFFLQHKNVQVTVMCVNLNTYILWLETIKLIQNALQRILQSFKTSKIAVSINCRVHKSRPWRWRVLKIAYNFLPTSCNAITAIQLFLSRHSILKSQKYITPIGGKTLKNLLYQTNSKFKCNVFFLTSFYLIKTVFKARLGQFSSIIPSYESIIKYMTK